MIKLPCPDAPRVSIVIPAFSSGKLLLDCLAALEKNLPPQPLAEIIVILNQARDDAEAKLAGAVCGIRTFVSTVNLGLAGASNRGRAMARSDLIVLLHDDAEVQPGWLESLIEAADAHPEAGAIGSKVLRPDGSIQDVGSVLWSDGTTTPRQNHSASEKRDPNAIHPVDYCGTSSLLIRAAVWDAMGGLDEQFYPAYFLDADIGMAVRRLGGVVLCQPSSVIIHHQSSSTTPHFREFLIVRNRQKFRDKWRSELEGHEPPLVDLPKAMDRAVTRAEARRASASPKWGPIVPKPSLDPARAGSDDAIYLKKTVDLQKDYIRHMDPLLDCASIPLYNFGTRLTFDSHDRGHKYAVDRSFYDGELCGAWMVGGRCRLLLPLLPHERSSTTRLLTIEIEAFHLLAAQRRQSLIRLIVNGVPLLKIIERRRGVQIYSAEIPQQLSTNRDCLDIRIESDRPMSPAELQIGPDTRTLSVCLVSVTVSCLA